MIGYPDWWDPARHRNAKRPSSTALTQTKAANVPSTSSALVTTTEEGTVLNITAPVLNNTWIIDSGATDHMTFDVRHVPTLKPSSRNCVSTANGNTNTVLGERSSNLTKTLHLDSVLVVPSLNYNLLSVSQITTTLSCVVIFGPNSCVFKDIQTQQTIGYGIKKGMLYYLDLESTKSNKLQQALAVNSTTSSKKMNEIWLWHRCWVMPLLVT